LDRTFEAAPSPSGTFLKVMQYEQDKNPKEYLFIDKTLLSYTEKDIHNRYVRRMVPTKDSIYYVEGEADFNWEVVNKKKEAYISLK